MWYRCRSKVLYISLFNPVCPFETCVVEVDDKFIPSGCLYNAVYQEWEKIEETEVELWSLKKLNL